MIDLINNKMYSIEKNDKIREFHLFAGIGGGIYGGALLGHTCVGGVEIDDFCVKIIKQRQQDGWFENFPIYNDVKKLKVSDIQGQFDILCGGFPCQAFSHAAHGKNIKEKDLWGEMHRIIQESNANIVFGENVTEKALNIAKKDLQNSGFIVYRCKVSCEDLGADHRRNRYWLLGIKAYDKTYLKVVDSIKTLPIFNLNCWTFSPNKFIDNKLDKSRRNRLKAIGNAQSPFAAATAFRILLNRHIIRKNTDPVIPSQHEINSVIKKNKSWIKETYKNMVGLVHTPTTMANYCCDSMMKHQGCRNYKEVFNYPTSKDAEYLMGLPIGASSELSQPIETYNEWNNIK